MNLFSIIRGVAATMTVFAFAACGGDDTPPGGDGGDATAPSITVKPDRVVLDAENPGATAFTVVWSEAPEAGGTVQLSNTSDFRIMHDFSVTGTGGVLDFQNAQLNTLLTGTFGFEAGREAVLYVRMRATVGAKTLYSDVAEAKLTAYADEEPAPVAGVFAKGADVSWLTQLESEGYKFYTPGAERKQMECMELLRDYCGVNSIRLRVWVNPSDGWNNLADVLVKARRARQLGLRLMIDFHFSDTWADPAHQTPPAAWKDYDVVQMKAAVGAHVTEVLSALKAEDIVPEWVQVGNETRDGFLYPLGQASVNPDNFVILVNAGYEAVKAVCPDAKVIVHVDQGDNLARYTWLFDILKSRGGNYDMIGMSLYPAYDAWREPTKKCVINIAKLYASYGKPVMVCEIGLSYWYPENCSDMINILLDAAAAGAPLDGILDGVFYWEPEAPNGYNGGYDKGAFKDDAPTSALPDSFGRH